MIREAANEDAPGIAEVNAAAWPWAYADILSPETIEDETDPLTRALQTTRIIARGDLFLVADGADGIVAYASEFRPPQLEGFDAEIGSLYVHPDFAGRGLGRALVGALTCRLWDRGARSLAVNTLAANAIGRGFYERLGGTARTAPDWESLPCVWYTWDEGAMSGLIPSVP